MFVDISRIDSIRHPEDECLWSCLQKERGQVSVVLILKGMHETRDAAANLAAIVMDTLTNMKFEVGKFNPCLCTYASNDIRLFHHGADFVTLADEGDLQWFAKVNEALIVKVRGVLGGGEGDMKEITVLHRIMRYGQTLNDGPFFEWEGRSDASGNRHGNAPSETCGRHQDAEFTRHSEKHG